jgi:hypothetical protein
VGTLREIVVLLHLIGFALLLGGGIAQYLNGRLRINAAMLWGAVTQVVTGLILAAPWGVDENSKPNGLAVGIKLVIALAILAMVFFARRREAVNRGHFLAILGLTLVNAAIGVFWLG